MKKDRKYYAYKQCVSEEKKFNLKRKGYGLLPLKFKIIGINGILCSVTNDLHYRNIEK